MTATLILQRPKALAGEFRAETRAAKPHPTAVLRRAAASHVRDVPAARHAVVEHLRARAGTWDGDVSGAELLRRTRP